jgi:thioesterase domain-containing protein/acyl carrier protein
VLEAMAISPGVKAEDALLAVTTLSFDIAALELFLPLSVGARVVLASQATAADGVRLARELESSGATIMQATPSTWRLLLYSGWEGDGRLKIVSGGEPLTGDLAKALLERGSELWNVYGPTETTIWVTAEQVHDSTQITIGRPLDNTYVYVLDESLQPLPAGIPGELFVGGACLARGYLRRPELTEERFIADPFAPSAVARLYRTGDIGRWRSDGRLELYGRTDNQLKLRGHRIEPGEIETILTQHPSVLEAAVVMTEKAPGDQRLMAFTVCDPSVESPTPEELRHLLRGRVPEYMVPSAFVTLDHLPSTPNGKIDRTALCAIDPPDCSRSGDSVGFEAPRTRTEVAIADIWTELLGVDRVGIHDNFFDLGGQSLLTIRMFHTIRERFGVDLPLATFFPEGTVASLAAALDTARPSRSLQSIIALQPHGHGAPFFCIHGVEGEIVRFARLARYLGEDQPFFGIRARGLDDGTQPHATISEMLSQYVVEMRQVSSGPYRIGGFSFGGILALELANRLCELGERVELVAVFDTPCYRSQVQIAREVAGLPGDLLAYAKNVLRPENRLKFVAGELRGSGRAAAWLLGARRLPPHAQDLERLVSEIADVSSPHQKVAQANLNALAGFRPRPYAGRVTLFRARVRPLLDSHSPTLGWEQLALGGVDVQHVPGTHASIFDEPHVRDLAEQLRRVL